ncbi:hypothetical protein FFI16_005850 [Pseudomonas sp. KBS0710]|uniref:hypothetical protein n=1 Tax=Pseudomonas sp. KBS0710 TaxID=1179667 RepID=UPI00110DBDD6|nr:hypothetical protein [Pseudomonas sp. KBS0710]TSD75963.1 hypothetical protein FFI16_005850 [Pseudomonas sp. KBS0710]
MAFTDSSFTNIAVGTKLIVVEQRDRAHRNGTFISAKNGTLTIYWTTYGKNMPFSYDQIDSVKIGDSTLNEDGSLRAPKSSEEDGSLRTPESSEEDFD